MTESHALTELFEGREIRAIEHQSEIWVPIGDIAKAWGVERSTPDKIIDRNPEAFESLTATVLDVASTPMSCLNERGLYLMMGKITASRLKNKKAKAAIIRFQKWFPELIEKYRKNEMQIQSKIVKDRGEGWSSIAIEHINFARELMQNNPGLDPGMCLAIGIREAEKATGKDLTPYKRLIPASPAVYQEEYVTATQIGREVGRTAAEVNRYLETTGYLYRSSDNTYYLTASGALHGRVFPGAFNSGHNGYFIKWKRSIIPAAKMRENSPHRIQ